MLDVEVKVKLTTTPTSLDLFDLLGIIPYLIRYDPLIKTVNRRAVWKL
jgi:hypothetical protein